MNGTLGVALAGLLVAGEQGGEYIVTGNTVRPEYNQTEYESARGSAVFRVRFRNGPEESGRVDQLLINGRPVSNAAETLQIRAARRGIDSVEIMNCGMDTKHPVFRGMMRLSKAASQAATMPDMLFFRLSREGRKGWKISVD